MLPDISSTVMLSDNENIIGSMVSWGLLGNVLGCQQGQWCGTLSYSEFAKADLASFLFFHTFVAHIVSLQQKSQGEGSIAKVCMLTTVTAWGMRSRLKTILNRLVLACR